MDCKKNIRVEYDKIGSVEIEEDVLYGINTFRAKENFEICNRNTNFDLIKEIVLIKKAAAVTNKKLNILDENKCNAISNACDMILTNFDKYKNYFITNALQGGAGTSANMNVNEVVANVALINMGRRAGEYDIINPLDDVNKGQSTNDVYPTALRIASIKLVRKLSEECAAFQSALQKKEQEFEDIIKLGRTELMDAVPITLGQEFGAYAQAISRDRWRIYKTEERLRQINLGGTAVGTGINVSRKFAYEIIEVLRDFTGIGLAYAEYPMDLTQNNDVFAEVSGLLKALSVNLIKICNDLRLMNSGPNGGLGEITFKEVQAGSSIMPGKVNPVIAEMVTQTAIKVIANDTAITICAAGGQFELNAFMPLISESILESISLLKKSLKIFREKGIAPLEANPEKCKEHLERSTVLITLLTPYIGYDAATRIMKKCGSDKNKIVETILNENLMNKERLDEILSYKKAITYMN